jgi:hypothetical protein
VTGKDLVKRAAHGVHLVVLQRPHRARQGVPGCQQQRVALPQRDLQVVGQTKRQLAAGPRVSRLDDADVPGRHRGLLRHVELAEPTLLPPASVQLADPRVVAWERERGHGPNVPTSVADGTYV